MGVHEAEGELGTGTALFASLKAELLTWWDQGTESRGHILRVIKGKVRESTMGENFQQKLVIGWKKNNEYFIRQKITGRCCIMLKA